MCIVKIETNLGVFNIQLFLNDAPLTVKNFIEHVERGFYNETIFHRVIPGFMIQGGGFKSHMEQKETTTKILNEANNGLKNVKYSVAMARTNEPHSASTQFFINVADNHFLDFKNKDANGWGYAVFGEVIEGKEVVDKISLVKTGNYGFHKDVPQEEIIMWNANILKN